jgi:hypothetical protein
MHLAKLEEAKDLPNAIVISLKILILSSNRGRRSKRLVSNPLDLSNWGKY